MPSGWAKLNIDGSVSGAPGRVGAGSVIGGEERAEIGLEDLAYL